MSLHSFDLPTDFDGQARLFPLSDLVMFPNNLLPLHIFESRYCEMLEDATRSDQLIAMATLLPGFEDEYYVRRAKLFRCKISASVTFVSWMTKLGCIPRSR